VRDTAAYYAEVERRFRAPGLAPVGDVMRPLERPLRIAAASTVTIEVESPPPAAGVAPEDDDLIAFIEAAPERCRAVAVKAAMRGGNLGQAADDEGNDAEILAALDEFLI
jgi:hypothetical protein